LYHGGVVPFLVSGPDFKSGGGLTRSMVGSIPIYSRHNIFRKVKNMSDEIAALVINSHVIKCPVCDGEQGIVLVWNDGDVDLICMGCKHKERFSVE
jgi:hypothetical protein